MSKQRRKGFLGMVLWAIMMILGLSALIIGLVVFLVLEENIPLGLILGGLGGFTFVFSLKKIINNEKEWKHAVCNEILNTEEEILAQWKFSLKEWEPFALNELDKKRKTPIILTVAVTSLVFIGMFIGAWLNEDEIDTQFWKITLSITVGIGFMMWYIGLSTLENIRNTLLELPNGQKSYIITIGKKGLVINDKLLTAFQFFGGQLTKVKQTEIQKQKVLNFNITINNGDSDVNHEYNILIPESTEQQEVDVILASLKHQYSLSDS